VRAVAQRVSRAEVRVEQELAAQMGEGLLALVGVAAGDTERDAQQLADKLVALRVFPDDAGRMNRSLLDTSGELGVVSQFTLLGDCRKGRRPSYDEAAAPELAEPLLEALVERARGAGVRVITGRFRARMQVSLVNEGPVTLLLDTARRF
jgi:D-tyrosyl-tRNA(Tyr) deacylase